MQTEPDPDEAVKAFFDHDVFLFDCDGVLYHEGVLIPGGPELIDRLNKLGKRVFFITNSGERTREGFCQKLIDIGITSARTENIVSAAYVTVQYLKKKLSPGSKVLLFGEGGLSQEIKRDDHLLLWEEGKDDESEITAIVCGLDFNFSYEKASRAVRVLCKDEKRKVLFVSTCKDKRWVTKDGRVMVSSAFTSGAIESCLDGGRKSKSMGKPSLRMLKHIQGVLSIEENQPSKHLRYVMIGDNIDSDIRMANDAGMAAILVLSGVTKRGDIKRLTDGKDTSFLHVFGSTQDIISRYVEKE